MPRTPIFIARSPFLNCSYVPGAEALIDAAIEPDHEDQCAHRTWILGPSDAPLPALGWGLVAPAPRRPGV